MTMTGGDARPTLLLFAINQDQEKLPAALQLLPETKKREPEVALRRMHVETLILLCTTRAGREHLRNKGVYEIVRAAHLVETVEEVR